MELERDVEAYLMREVEKLGGLCLKHGQDGWPDRIVLLPGGRTIWCETKRTDGKLSVLQQLRAKDLKALGHTVYPVWSKQDVDMLIKEVMQDDSGRLSSDVATRHGRWFEIIAHGGLERLRHEEIYAAVYRCSVCNGEAFDYDYCPNCGAKMDG